MWVLMPPLPFLLSTGQAVKAGEPLLVLEAMKMEHTLRADADATVDKTFGREGEVVGGKAVLVTFADKS